MAYFDNVLARDDDIYADPPPPDDHGVYTQSWDDDDEYADPPPPDGSADYAHFSTASLRPRMDTQYANFDNEAVGSTNTLADNSQQYRMRTFEERFLESDKEPLASHTKAAAGFAIAALLVIGLCSVGIWFIIEAKIEPKTLSLVSVLCFVCLASEM